jgi:long-chain acyl-CoA synthetase
MTARGIHDLARTEPDRTALVFHDGAISFAELDAATNRIAHRLADASVGQGDRVAVACTNRPELFAAWNAAARVGALVVPVSYRFTPPEVGYLLEDSGARALVHDLDRLPDIDIPIWHVHELDEGPTDPPSKDFVGTPVMWMTYTSGTTGKPKGIVRPTPQPMRETPPQPYMQFWGFGRDDVHLLTGPAYHTAPGAYAQMHLVEGASVVLMPRFDAAECLRLIDRWRVTNSHMVPANFSRILDLPPDVREGYDLSSVRKIIHGAAFCPEVVKREIMEVFPPDTVWEYYGASEGMGSVISPAKWLEHPGSVGRPFPGLEVRILDDDGAELPPGEVGTVYISSVPGYEFEYHNAPDKTREAWREQRFTVGDLGWVDDEGYLYLADRRTDLILRGGVNVYPAEVEAALVEHREVVDAAVFGLPDKRLGQRVHAVVELTDGADADEGALLGFLAERLADFKRPETIELVDTLPREPTGKIRKTDLRAARAGDLGFVD